MMLYKTRAFVLALGLFQLSFAMEPTPEVSSAQDTSLIQDLIAQASVFSNRIVNNKNSADYICNKE